MRRALCTASAPTRVQTAVIGAGVVGLATARALALAGHEVIILESGPAEGTGTSSRNSEVVHAGIYYEEGSLKAQTCVAGRRMLYDFCDAHGVEYKRCGKLLVATSQDEVPMLDAIAEKARRCGLVDEDEALRRLSVAEVEAYEPNVSCVGALLSPSTGIVDSHSLMVALLGGAESAGATLAVGSRVTGARVLHGDGRLLLHTTADDGESMALDCNHVVNAAGHGAPAIARLLEGAPPQHEEVVPPQAYYAKGNYFGLQGPSPFNGLVYPLPQQAGLGVHATVDLAGRCRFGPDVQWTDRVRPTKCRRHARRTHTHVPCREHGLAVCSLLDLLSLPLRLVPSLHRRKTIMTWTRNEASPFMRRSVSTGQAYQTAPWSPTTLAFVPRSKDPASLRRTFSCSRRCAATILDSR